jgi:hypothetical protein
LKTISSDDWESLRTSYPPGEAEVSEREAATRNGFVVDADVWEVIAAVVVVGKWKSRRVRGISKRSGKLVCSFPRSGFSTTNPGGESLPLQCAGHDCRPLFRFGA